LLEFHDFSLENVKSTNSEAGNMIRVSIDGTSGTAKDNFLRTIENLFPSGSEVNCCGSIGFFAQDRDKADQIASILKLGFQWITSIGSLKGTGLGRLTGNTLEIQEQTASNVNCTTHDNDFLKYHILIEQLEDLLVGGIRRTNNFIESEKIITGAVLKGALASNINRFCGAISPFDAIDEQNQAVREHFPYLAKYFKKIKFSHAFPKKSCSLNRPVFIPLSAVMVDQQFQDVALFKKPVLDSNYQAPAFQIDWKKRANGNNESIDDLFGWPELVFRNKTRTAIHPQSRTAFSEKLFTFQYISPYVQSDGVKVSNQKIQWVCNILMPNDIDSSERGQLVQELLHAMAQTWKYLGKKRTQISIEVKPGHMSPNMDSEPTIIQGLSVITLQSDAYLINCLPLAKDPAKLRNLYKHYWESVSDGSLKLSHYYAKQKMEGGYRYLRYRRNTSYYPYFLTCAGSVFTLETVDESKAKKHLDNWIQQGLPLPEFVHDEFGVEGEPLWKTFPYVPENGYGEIIVNLKWHWQHQIMNAVELQ
jgi:hypothetical protein